LHPDIGKIGLVDGSLLQAHLPQRKPNGPAERAAMLSGRWHKVGYIVYTDSNGSVTARCHGHYADSRVMPTRVRSSCSGRVRARFCRHNHSASRNARTRSVGW
jgi:hypothetical protein